MSAGSFSLSSRSSCFPKQDWDLSLRRTVPLPVPSITCLFLFLKCPWATCTCSLIKSRIWMYNLLKFEGFSSDAQLPTPWSPSVDSPSIMSSFLTFPWLPPADLTFIDVTFIDSGFTLMCAWTFSVYCMLLSSLFWQMDSTFCPPFCYHLCYTETNIVSMNILSWGMHSSF